MRTRNLRGMARRGWTRQARTRGLRGLRAIEAIKEAIVISIPDGNLLNLMYLSIAAEFHYT
jgi:hypothetical protein